MPISHGQDEERVRLDLIWSFNSQYWRKFKTKDWFKIWKKNWKKCKPKMYFNIEKFHSIKTENFDLAKYAAVNQDLTRTRSSSVKHSCLLEKLCEIITHVEIHDCHLILNWASFVVHSIQVNIISTENEKAYQP